MNQNQITIDYQKAIGRVRNLRQAASECDANRTMIRAMSNNVSDGLEGAAAAALLEKLQAWSTENDRLQQALYNAAQRLETTANALREADLAAARNIPVAGAAAPAPRVEQGSSRGATFAKIGG